MKRASIDALSVAEKHATFKGGFVVIQ